MANQIKAPINYPIIAGGKIVSGGSVLFGQPNVKPDEDNPSTLKAIYLDAALSQQAENPQGISSDGVFDQSDTGILYGPTDTVYSIVIRGANKKELSYIPEYDLSDSNAAQTAQDAASAAASSESNAIAAKDLTEALYTDFTNRYFGAYSSDPSVDPEGNPPSEGSIYFNTTSNVFFTWHSGAWNNDFPSNPNGLMVTATGTTTPRSLADRFTDIVDSKDYGAGSGGDDTLKIQNLVNNHKRVHLSGSLVLQGSVQIPSGVDITADCQITHGGNYYPLRCSGSSSQVAIFVSDHSLEFSSFDVDDASVLNVGDYLRLVSTQSSVESSAGDWQLDDSGNPTYFAEFVQIRSISGNNITITGKTNFPLYPSGSSVELVDFAQVRIEGSVKSAKSGNSFELVRLDFCKDSVVSGIEEDSKTFTGPTVTIRDSLNCEGVNIITKLDPSIEIDYLGNNPAFPDYFEYNSLKIISAQSCGFVSCKMFNGTQNIDITYSGKPSVKCYARNNRVYYARHNMLTTHAGSFNNLLEGNVGVMCERGISTRSRADIVRNNVISGVSNVGVNTQSNTYGIAVSDGFNKGAIIRDNEVKGFYRNYLLNSANISGFTKNDIKLIGGTSSNAARSVTISRATSNPSNEVVEDQGIEIHGLVMTDITTSEGVIELNNPYITGVVINNCTFPEDIGADKYCISAEENCTGLTVTNNILPKIGRALLIGGITDPAVGDNTIRDLNATWLSNSKRGYNQDNSFVFDGNFVGRITPVQSELDVRTVGSTDSDLQVGGQEILELNNTSGSPLSIENLVGGVKGQQLLIYASSGSNTIEINDTAGNVSLKSPSPYTLTRFASGSIKLICVSDSLTGGSNWLEI